MQHRFQLRAAALAVSALALASGAAQAHQTYNLTGDNIGLVSSINNTDGVSNTGGYRPVGVGGRVAGNANANIPGTGGLPTDYVGALPYMLYLGHHDTTAVAQTTRNGLTGSSASTANSLWKAYATQDASATWGSLVPDIGSGHPYFAVGANSWQVGSTAGGLDYNLIHASCGTNNNAQNCSTAPAAAGKVYKIDITLKRDAIFNSENDPAALLDVALYRGADSSSGASRTAAFDPFAAGVQGSTLGTGGPYGSALLWSAHQVSASDVLTFSLLINLAEWQKSDAVNGGLNDGDAGYYTLIVGAHGGLNGAGVAYTLDTHSYSAVPLPGSFALMVASVGGLGAWRRRRAGAR